MKCEKCNSDNTQRLQVVFESGTSAINTHSNTVGAGFGGAFGIGGATTKTTGTSQTVLGGKAAPPLKKPYKWAVISLLVGFVFFIADGKVLGGILMAAGAIFVYAAATYNKNQWPSLYKHWQDCWLCHKCGHIYHHP